MGSCCATADPKKTRATGLRSARYPEWSLICGIPPIRDRGYLVVILLGGSALEAGWSVPAVAYGIGDLLDVDQTLCDGELTFPRPTMTGIGYL